MRRIRVEILAERGNSFTFEGRIVAVDLRSRVLSLSNDSDQSVRELAIGSLDTSNLSLLREGADVSIQAEFDGDRYNVRTVTLASPNPSSRSPLASAWASVSLQDVSISASFSRSVRATRKSESRNM